jgi:hypothetical protein
MARLTDDEIRTLTDAEIQDATSFVSGDIARDRAKAEYYFLGLPKGDLSPPEIEGRSSVVDTTVRNTVLGMEAPLIKTFCGTENVVEFSETQPEDAEKAKLATEYLNYILRKKNPGFQIISTWIRDSLLQKVGFIKVWWDDSAIESTEEYRAQSPEQLAMLLDDDEIEVTAQKAYEDEEAAKAKQKQLEQMQAQIAQALQAVSNPANAGNGDPLAHAQQMQQQMEAFAAQPVPMLYDITVKRTKSGGRLCIENVPYDEMLVSRKCKRMDDDTFKAHRVIRTIGYLRAAGYKNVDDIESDESAWVTTEATERSQMSGGNQSMLNSGSLADPDMREVWITECYVKADIDGSGIAEWRKIVRAGKSLLENEPVDENPFVALHSIPLAHRFFGMSPADLAIPAQRLKTSLKRAALDNMYLQVNGRYFAVEGQVNLDDLLNSRPGGVVRIKNQGAVGRLDQGMGDIAGAMSMLENAEMDAEESTGWSRSSQGGNGLQLSQTATQSNIITNRADSRVEMISRTMAETGFTDLFRKMLRLVTQYQNKAEQAKLGGKWVSIDPREWTNQFDLDIHVGLGTGNKDQQVQHLMALSQQQQLGLQVGTTTPENVYHAQVKFAEALGFKNGGEQFFTDPQKIPPKQPPQDPAIVKAQLADQQHQRDVQLKAQQSQLEAQAKQAQAQMEAQLKQYEVQVQSEAQMQTDRARQENEAQMHALKVQYESELAQLKEHNRMQERAQELAFQQYKLDKEIDARIVIAQITAKQAADASLQAAEAESNKDMANDE